MSRLTASPPPERGIPSEARPPRERSDDHERQAMRPRRACQPVLLGADGDPARVPDVRGRRPQESQPALKPFGGALRC